MKKIWLAASLFFASHSVWGADLLKAEQLLGAGQADAALLEVEAFLANDPTNPDGRFIQGISLARLGRADEAITVFRDLTSDYREIPEPYNNLAVLLAQTGDYTGARNALEEAVKYHPNYTVAWENLADIYSVMATVAYEKVLEQDPANAVAKQRLAAMSGAVTEAPAPAPTPSAPQPAPKAADSAGDSLAAVPILPTGTDVEEVLGTEESAPAPVQQQAVVAATNLPPEQEAVMGYVRSWASAWSEKDIESYIGAYGSNFQPQDNQTRGDWEKGRRARLAKPSQISLQLSQPSVTFLDSDLAMVKFVQAYRSNTYQDTVRKTLLMEREGSDWRIVREQSIR
ncbi:MAG: tetratricopeptide repeat protein [Gammaproteobacteria bacterium]|nr:tetratricopeptide repeat protein [Gammaproteobacteria bacterium]